MNLRRNSRNNPTKTVQWNPRRSDAEVHEGNLEGNPGVISEVYFGENPEYSIGGSCEIALGESQKAFLKEFQDEYPNESRKEFLKGFHPSSSREILEESSGGISEGTLEKRIISRQNLWLAKNIRKNSQWSRIEFMKEFQKQSPETTAV